MSDNLTNTELLLKAVLQEIKWVKIAVKQQSRPNWVNNLQDSIKKFDQSANSLLEAARVTNEPKPDVYKGYLQGICISLLTITVFLLIIIAKI